MQLKIVVKYKNYFDLKCLFCSDYKNVLRT